MAGEWIIFIWALVIVIFLVKNRAVADFLSRLSRQPRHIQGAVLAVTILATLQAFEKSTNETEMVTIEQTALTSSASSFIPLPSSFSSSSLPSFWNDDATDTDEDGIPDLWEKWTHGNRYVADSGIDRDEDGLTDLEEFQNQTDPRTADTDGDGFSDSFEVANGMNPVVSEDFTPIEPDTNNNGLPDIWDQAGYGSYFYDADHDGFDDYYETYYLPSVLDSNFDALVDIYTSRSVLLYWENGSLEGSGSIVIPPTTGTSVKIRLPFGSDTAINLLPTPYGTDPPSGELWKSRMRLSFAPRPGQSLVGNALVSTDGMIAHKVVNLESVVMRFATTSPSSGFQTLSLTDGGAVVPSTDIKARRFEVYCEDNYHGVGDVVGALSVTDQLGMDDAIYDWSSAFGDLDPNSGIESWLTVTRVPDYDEEMTVVTATQLDSVSRIAVTSIVEKCSPRVFSANFSTGNFSPHLGEKLDINVTIPGCGHFSSLGWLEVEVVREIIGATQHVASVDMDPETEAVDRYLDTSVLGGQTLMFEWDGLAQASLPEADHPDIFNGSGGRSIHRAMPDVEAGRPVPPPFCTIRVRLWNSGKTEVLEEYSETVFIPQVVKIIFLPEVVTWLSTPLIYTNADQTATTVYSGVESEAAAEQILQNMPQYIMAFMPDDVNIRFVNSEQSVLGAYTGIIMMQSDSSTENELGLCLVVDRRNSTPTGICFVYVRDIYEIMRDYYRLRDMNNDVFNIPLSGPGFANLLSDVSVHEVGHALGLVDPDVLDAISSNNPHNLYGTGLNIMDVCVFKKMSDVLSPSKTKYWRRNNRYYMEFCLPKKKWGLL